MEKPPCQIFRKVVVGTLNVEIKAGEL
jgi:hypothetical protein